jgi:hypothetical protein
MLLLCLDLPGGGGGITAGAAGAAGAAAEKLAAAAGATGLSPLVVGGGKWAPSAASADSVLDPYNA